MSVRRLRVPPAGLAAAAAVGLVAAVAGAVAPTAAAQHLSVTLEPEAITVGDRVSAVVTLRAPRERVAGEPRFPDWGGAWGEAEVLDAGPVERLPEDAGTATWRQRLTLTAFRTGHLPLPPRTVTLPLAPQGRSARGARGEAPRELATPADLALTVRSVLPEGEEATSVEPAPPEPPRPLPAGSRFWWTLATAALAAVVAAVAAVARRPRIVARGRRRPTPLEELVEHLRTLSGEPSAERAHEELSLALRRYLGRTLDFTAVESTTTEVKRHLRQRGVHHRVVTRADEVLRACDRVKFAREPAGRSSLGERLDVVREIARELDCRLHRPEDGECAERGGP